MADHSFDMVLHHALSYRAERLRDQLVNKYGSKILGGPFAGMAIGENALGSVLLPKMIGTYERELWPFIDEIIATPYENVLNIGSGEGYYVVGLAMKMPDTRFHAFDAEPNAAGVCHHNALLNGVNLRIGYNGICVHQNLIDNVKGRTLIICDCEGCEYDLLDPAAVPNLLNADILIEMHDHEGTRRGGFYRRFAATHDIRTVISGGRDPTAIPQLDDFGEFDRWLAVCEFRGRPQEFAFMTVRR